MLERLAPSAEEAADQWMGAFNLALASGKAGALCVVLATGYKGIDHLVGTLFGRGRRARRTGLGF